MKENAVSEVIGVVLLLALVVIGVSLVGVIIFSSPLPGKIPQVKVIPQSICDQITGHYNNAILITHDGGDLIEPDNLQIKINNDLIYNSDISILGPGCSFDPWIEPWKLGESLFFNYNISPPQKLDLIYTLGGRENLIFSSSNIQKLYGFCIKEGGDPTQDTEPPVICCVSVPTVGGGVPACNNVQISWVATDNIAIKSALVEFYEGSGWISLPKMKSSSPYSWTVPAQTGPGKQIRVTVTDLNGNTASNSSSVFSITDTITPGVTVSSPKGGETWDVGTKKSITWQVSGECDPNRHASIQLSPDNKVTWITVISGIVDTGSYEWTVSNNPSNEAYIKVLVTDSAGNVGEGISPNKFSIRETIPPSIQVIQPNNGEILTVGIPYTIQWSATDASGVDYVNIDISYDGGSSWTSLLTNWENTGSHTWIPQTESNNARLRITAWDIFGNSYSDLSDGGFTIQAGSPFLVTLSSPNGGENLVPGNIHQIQWSVEGGSSSDQATIEYSTENGVDGTWKSIGTVTGSNQYSWNIPCELSNTVRVKVTVTRSGGGLTGFDISNGPFSITSAQSVGKVLLPNGGEILYGGTAYSIQWIASNPCGVTGVDLLFSEDNGGVWQSIVTGTSNTGSYSWNVPNIISSNCKIRMIAHITGGLTVQDDSDSTFEIRNAAPLVVVTSPNGGEQWETGSQHPVTWTATDSDGVTSVNIDYSTNNGLTWTNVASGLTNTGSYTWTVPAPTTIQGLIRVTATDSNGNNGVDQSNAVFRVINGLPQVVVTYPNGGETFSVDGSTTITWTAIDPDGISSVDLAYSINDNPFTFSIASGISNTGSHPWDIPALPSNKVRVIVTAYDQQGGKGSDQSNNFFTIADTTPPTISVGKPVTGEAFRTYSASGKPYMIVWSADDNVNVARIRLEYSTNGGSSWIQIIDNLSNNGYYYWYVPGPTSNNCIVQAWAYDAGGLSASAVSGIFRITN